MEMYTRKLGTLLSLTLLFAFTGVLAELQMPQASVEVTQGRKVVLQAWYSPNTNMERNIIIWNYVANDSKLIISYTLDSLSFGESPLQGRVGFTATMPSTNVSLYINNTKESDSGRYMCQVIFPGTGIVSGLVTTTLNVKVPPAVPECSLSGKPVLKANVSLSCMSGSGKPVPVYRWQKTTPESQYFFAPHQNEVTGVLRLTNLSSNMSGKYVCTSSNTAGEERCYINLEVITSTNSGMIAGATVGSVFGFIFIILFLIFLLKRRRDTEEDLANDIKEDAQAPKRVSWAKSGSGSDIISKNGTLSSITSSPHQRAPYHHHPALQQYPQRPPSDTASVLTTAGSTAGYRPRQASSTPTPAYGYSSNSAPRGEPASNGSSLARTERSTPLPQTHPQTYAQVPRPPPLPSSVVTASNISRMGGVPIMVPAQNQAGSLV
ncbi:endothelial cell adhesion molecule a [Osmerus eperlanus]|uniref:endothelial cell adhesion molecule a n=1 Tax=Osmerus eperlanus TaxID=29151 RepID=UPI002E138D07